MTTSVELAATSKRDYNLTGRRLPVLSPYLSTHKLRGSLSCSEKAGRWNSVRQGALVSLDWETFPR